MDRSVDGMKGDSEREVVNLKEIRVSANPASKSLKFTKRLTVVVFSMITAAREIFDPSAYTVKRLTDVEFSVLSGTPNCEDAHQTTIYLRNALNALDKGYLRKLVLDFVNSEGSVVESYTIEYDYDEVSCDVSLDSNGFGGTQFDKRLFAESVEKLIVSLKQKLMLMGPSTSIQGLRFRVHHHDHTPTNYLPEQFRDIAMEELGMNNSSKEVRPMGSVAMPFHTMAVSVLSNNVAPTELVESSEDKADCPKRPKKAIKMNCVCQMNEKLSNVFECCNCKEWHHLICYRRKPTFIFNPGDKRVCFNCAKLDAQLECLDSGFNKSTHCAQVEHLAVYRQIIYELSGRQKIDVRTWNAVFQTTDEQKSRLMKKLCDKKILIPSNSFGVYDVQAEPLQQFTESYFHQK